MLQKKITCIITAFVFTIATVGCSSTIKKEESDSAKNTGTSQVAGGNAQQNSFALRVIIAVVVGAIISKVVKDKTEDKIDKTIEDLINNN